MKSSSSTFTTALATASVLSMALIAIAPAASADTPGCVTRAEFQRIDFYDSKRRVHAIYDTSGRQVGEGLRQYRTCRAGARSYSTVQYDTVSNAGVDWKWLYLHTSSNKRCVTSAEFRRVRVDMRKARVRKIFDTAGQSNTGGSGGYQQYYQACKRPHLLVEIGYEVPPRGADNVYGKWYRQHP